MDTRSNSRKVEESKRHNPRTGCTSRRACFTHRLCDTWNSRSLWFLAAALLLPAAPVFAQRPSGEFHDLSLLVAPEFPCTWPSMFPSFQISHRWQVGAASAYNVDVLVIDPNTGTQMDVPPHSVSLPDSKLPSAGPFGTMYNDKVPAWQFCGEACVIDCKDLIESAPSGRSDLVTKERIQAWERDHRPLKAGDVVLVHSGYTDKFYRPLPEGRRFLADPLDGKVPAWPDPDPDCMEYLASRGVMLVGTDSPSMGPIPLLAEPTHYAGLKHGMIFTESLTNLGSLPATGAFYCVLGVKHVGSAGSESRAIAITGPLAEKLLESARNKHVVDLSVPLSPDLPVWWPGTGAGTYWQPFIKVHFGFNPNVNSSFQTHWMDSMTGTHLVPPGFSTRRQARRMLRRDAPPTEAELWREEYESSFGPQATEGATAEKVPLDQTCGQARIIDVKHLIGTTDTSKWPASPQITPEIVSAYEKEHGDLEPGQVVIFRSGYSDARLKPMPEGSACMADPLAGKSEGWPAPTPETIQALGAKGIRCVATDGPTLGGVNAKSALHTYLMLASRRMVGVHFLTNLADVPDNAYFLFAPAKIKGCHGGPGRALALY